MNKKQDFLPIVLGSDENAYGIARLYVEAYGVKPLIICSCAYLTIKNSKILRYEEYDNFDMEKVFVPILKMILNRESKYYNKFLVIPCSDNYFFLLTKNYNQFKGLISNSFISKELLFTFNTKSSFSFMCKEYGLPHPETVVVPYEKRESVIDEIPFGYPIVVKPDNSNSIEYLYSGFKGKKKVFFFNTKEEYITTIRAMNTSEYRDKLVIQRYIPGGDENSYSINAYSDTNGKVRVIALGQCILYECAPEMIGNPAAIISRYDECVMKKVKDFLESISYVGFVNIDIKYDKNTKKMYYLEINPRLGRPNFFIRAAGTNIIKNFTDDVIYGKKTECKFVKQTALWRNVPVFILKKYIKNKQLLQEVLKLLREKKCLTSRYYEKDMNGKRLISMLHYDFARWREYILYGNDLR